MKCILFGELMGRLNPQGYMRFVQSDLYEMTYAGGEANVAVSLANYGVHASFVTKMPDNDISKSALRSLKAHDVDVSDVVFGGDRLGLYFVEKGASQRPSKVIYDRKYSAISMANPTDFNWEKIFKGANWFHFTGITPALSDNCAVICKEACQTAKKMNVKISCDLNFRKNLWSTEKANEVMSTLMQYVDVLIANEEDAEKVFGITANDTDVNSGNLSYEGYKRVAKTLSDVFGIPTVAITLRESITANDNNWAGMLYRDGNYYFSKKYKIHIVDRVGGGDSFGGGLIYALMQGYENQRTIDFAVAASALKHTIEHDFNEVSISEIENLINGGGSGRVQR